jgi:hypothetical protein
MWDSEELRGKPGRGGTEKCELNEVEDVGTVLPKVKRKPNFSTVSRFKFVSKSQIDCLIVCKLK